MDTIWSQLFPACIPTASFSEAQWLPYLLQVARVGTLKYTRMLDAQCLRVSRTFYITAITFLQGLFNVRTLHRVETSETFISFIPTHAHFYTL